MTLGPNAMIFHHKLRDLQNNLDARQAALPSAADRVFSKFASTTFSA